MKSFPLLLFFALFIALTASAQEAQSALPQKVISQACPKIDVTGGEVNFAENTTTFTLNVEGYDLSKLSFEWTISAGEILEGQYTASIKVLIKDDETVTAVIKVKGVPQGCPTTAAETSSTICRPHVRLQDEFSIQVSRIQKVKLDYFINEIIQENANSRAYIIEYFKRGTSEDEINRKIQKITDYLVNEKKFEKEQFTILTVSDSERNLTKFYIVPAGAELPQP